MRRCSWSFVNVAADTMGNKQLALQNSAQLGNWSLQQPSAYLRLLSTPRKLLQPPMLPTAQLCATHPDRALPSSTLPCLCQRPVPHLVLPSAPQAALLACDLLGIVVLSFTRGRSSKLMPRLGKKYYIKKILNRWPGKYSGRFSFKMPKLVCWPF